MQRKKKSKKKKKSVHPPLLPPEESLITSLIQDSPNTDPAEIAARVPDSRLAQILIDRLPLDDGSPIPLLLALEDAFEDNQVKKAVRQLLFKLKKRGIPVEDFYVEQRQPPAVLKLPQKEEPAAHIGALDMNGFRAVLVTLHRTLKGVDTGVGIVSDEHGIQQFLFGTFSKKRIKEVKDHVSQEGGPLVETSLSHAATILEKAYTRHLELHSDVPADYLEIRPWLQENVDLLDRPIIYESVHAETTSADILTDSRIRRLFQHELMEKWVIDIDQMKPLVEDILKIEDSPIFLTEIQKSDRIQQIKEKYIEDLFPATKRFLLKQGLEEMAYFFFKLDEEEYSRLCLAAAGSLKEQDTVFMKNPVIEFLLERSLDFYTNLIKNEIGGDKTSLDSPSQRIILP